ncbi:hypothetical protein L1887_48811 [Cichorium endivia]|nr:hypothetical protein L1887_48811 [Cichorium endivia]
MRFCEHQDEPGGACALQKPLGSHSPPWAASDFSRLAESGQTARASDPAQGLPCLSNSEASLNLIRLPTTPPIGTHSRSLTVHRSCSIWHPTPSLTLRGEARVNLVGTEAWISARWSRPYPLNGEVGMPGRSSQAKPAAAVPTLPRCPPPPPQSPLSRCFTASLPHPHLAPGFHIWPPRPIPRSYSRSDPDQHHSHAPFAPSILSH